MPCSFAALHPRLPAERSLSWTLQSDSQHSVSWQGAEFGPLVADFVQTRKATEEREESREQSAGAKVFLAAAAAPRRPALASLCGSSTAWWTPEQGTRSRAAGRFARFFARAGLRVAAESRKLLASPGFGRRTGGFTRLSATGGPRRRRSASQRERRKRCFKPKLLRSSFSARKQKGRGRTKDSEPERGAMATRKATPGPEAQALKARRTRCVEMVQFLRLNGWWLIQCRDLNGPKSGKLQRPALYDPFYAM